MSRNRFIDHSFFIILDDIAQRYVFFLYFRLLNDK